ncbi:hypothetical protein FJV76_18150 [Mesorhizobium sp. WSM4303]|nr:hypothetical protein FJV77_01910 [Mesorhizobium sp. WSM4306]TRD02780.1 hypothetical protein FJV76_18150 [Mesorhizobium sp. WSM4303]
MATAKSIACCHTIRSLYELIAPVIFRYCLLPTAYCLLPTAYCLLPTAYCLLPTGYRPISARAMITRMISLVPSRIWWTRRSRTSFSMP